MLLTSVTLVNLIKNTPLLLIYSVVSQPFITFLVTGLVFCPWLPLLIVVKPRDVPPSTNHSQSSCGITAPCQLSSFFVHPFCLMALSSCYCLLCYISPLFLLFVVSPDWPLNHSFWCVVSWFFGKR